MESVFLSNVQWINRNIYIPIEISIDSNWNLGQFPIEIPIEIPIVFFLNTVKFGQNDPVNYVTPPKSQQAFTLLQWRENLSLTLYSE